MAKVTLVFAVLLIALGLIGYWGTGSKAPTALIPTWFGLALTAGGLLAISRSEGRRKLFMHINVTVGLLGLIGAVAAALQGEANARSLGVFGFLAMSPSESRRKLFMHINVTIGLLGFLGAASEAVRGYVKATSQGIEPDRIALASKVTMAGLLLIYVALCVRSFIAARRARKV